MKIAPAPAYITENGRTLKLGQQFRLTGCTMKFTAVAFYLAAGFIPSVRGMNDTHQTFARTIDVIAL